MADQFFSPEVKERDAGQPRFILLNTSKPGQQVTLHFPPGATVEDAQALAQKLHDSQVTVSIG
jgi:hypothetical protein